jgi:quercetin dioxygenase-like cupin family protein
MTKIREFATRWDGERTWFERDKESLIGSAKESKRNTPKFRPFDMLSEPNDSLILWENQDMRIGVESVVGPAPFFRRNCDYDELLFQFSGRTTVETEHGIFELKPSELLLIPGGIAHRSTGTADALRLFARLPEPVKIVLGDDKQSSHTEFDMVRKGGPQWSLRDGAEPTKGKVLERLFTWDAVDEEFTKVERDYAHLVGVASEGRGIEKLRAFDFFTGMTGKKGPGPKIYESSIFHVEVYNTEGDQFAFHRGLDDDELWLQFRGDSINESEFGVYHLLSGQMNHIPPGIAHRVVGGEGFLRIVFYSRRPWRLKVDPTKYRYKSSFEPREKVIKPAAWKMAATA